MQTRSVLLTAALALGAILLARLVAPALTFNLWDNFETFTPQALFAHSTWLGGHLPLLNVKQSLGVSPLGIGDNGVLYFPYTILLLIARVLGSDQMLPELIGTFHVTLAFAGWFAFARAMGVREGLALLFSSGVTGSGYFLLGSAIWHFIGVSYAWLPWILLGLKGVVETGSARALALFVVSWTLCAWGSHAQQLTYVGLHAGLMALVFTWPRRREWRVWTTLGVLAFMMAALALPALIYSFPIRALSSRAGSVSASEFFEYPFRFGEMFGLLTPTSKVKTGYLGCNLTWLVFAGSWILPGLLLTKRIARREIWFGLAFIALMFMDFAAGPNALVYPLTQKLPIWSSFRYVYKFAPHVTISLAMLAILGLEAGWDRWSPRARAVALTFICAAPLIRIPHLTSLWVLSGLQGVVALGALTRVGSKSPWIPRLAAMVCLAASLWVASDLSLHRYGEKYGEYGASYFGLDAPEKSRLVTLSQASCSTDACAMQGLSQFDSATVNGYFGLSGHQMGMTPNAIAENIAGNAWGILPPAATWAVGSHLFRGLAVRYYLLSEADLTRFEPIFAARGLREHQRGAGWRLFEDPRARDLVVIPEIAVPSLGEDIDPSLRASEGFALTHARGLPETLHPSATTVESTWWIEGRGMGFDVVNASSVASFAVASIFPWPFLEVEMDRAPVPFFSTNALSTGVSVPPGHHRVEIRASAQPLVKAALFALLVLLMGTVIILRSARARR